MCSLEGKFCFSNLTFSPEQSVGENEFCFNFVSAKLRDSLVCIVGKNVKYCEYILIYCLWLSLYNVNKLLRNFSTLCTDEFFKLLEQIILLTFSPEQSVGKNDFCENEVDALLTFSPEQSVGENEFCENEVESKLHVKLNKG